MMHPLFANIISEAYKTSSLVNKLVIVVLVTLSVYTMFIIIGKLSEIKIVDELNKKFIRRYHGRIHPVMLFIEAEGRFAPGIPMAVIYTAVIKEFMSLMRKRGIQEADFLEWQSNNRGMAISQTEVAALKAVAEGSLSQQILFIESKMSNLATCLTSAPSIGLLGTVWGIMESFMAMAKSGSTLMIKTVAPGISGALLTTVAGLIIAIPAGFSYNYIADKIRFTTVNVENFTDQLIADIARLHFFPNEDNN